MRIRVEIRVLVDGFEVDGDGESDWNDNSGREGCGLHGYAAQANCSVVRLGYHGEDENRALKVDIRSNTPYILPTSFNKLSILWKRARAAFVHPPSSSSA